MMRVEVARNRELYAQDFSRGIPQGPVAKIGPAPNRRGTTVTFHPDPQIFGSQMLKPARMMRMARSKAYLFSGVEIRWKTAIDDGETPGRGDVPLSRRAGRLPGGSRCEKATTYADRPFAGQGRLSPKSIGVPGSVEWAINWSPTRDGFLQSYCNTVPTPEGGTHEAGFWAAILKGIRAYGERIKNRKAETDHPR